MDIKKILWFYLLFLIGLSHKNLFFFLRTVHMMLMTCLGPALSSVPGFLSPHQRDGCRINSINITIMHRWKPYSTLLTKWEKWPYNIKQPKIFPFTWLLFPHQMTVALLMVFHPEETLVHWGDWEQAQEGKLPMEVGWWWHQGVHLWKWWSFISTTQNRKFGWPLNKVR